MRPRTAAEEKNILPRVTRKGVRDALREHKRAGRCIYVSRNGKVVKLTPQQISV